VRIPVKGPKEDATKFAKENGDGDDSSSDSDVEAFEVPDKLKKKVQFKKKVEKIPKKSLLERVVESPDLTNDDDDFVPSKDDASSSSSDSDLPSDVDEREVRELLNGQSQEEIDLSKEGTSGGGEGKEHWSSEDEDEAGGDGGKSQQEKGGEGEIEVWEDDDEEGDLVIVENNAEGEAIGVDDEFIM
jgi:hypothetical protein